MAQTVTECLSAGADSVALINGINTDGASSDYAEGLENQAAIKLAAVTIIVIMLIAIKRSPMIQTP